MCPGTLPSEWLSPGSVLSATLLSLDLSLNRLMGSIPPSAGGRFLTDNTSSGQATDVVLDPMSEGYGLCGGIPSSMNVSSADGRQLQGSMPAGACPGIPDSHHAMARFRDAEVADSAASSHKVTTCACGKERLAHQPQHTG